MMVKISTVNQRKEIIQMVEPYKPLYTVKEAASLLQVNPNTVYDYIRSGQLTALKLGSTKIRGHDLEDFIDKYPSMTA